MIKILVVDDDDMTRFYLKKLILKKFGFHVEEASNGLEALNTLDNNSPDVIFLDISMPIMNGIEFLREIRRNAKFEKLNVVVMTAHNDRDTINELFQLGIQDYILKPFGHFKTFERLREILSDVQKKSKEKEVKPQNDQIEIKKPKLIIADLDHGYRRFVSQLLVERFKVLEAQDESSLIKITQNTNPHVIIVSKDIIGSNKVSIINSIKNSETSHKTKIYLSSSAPEAVTTGFYDGYIQKTFMTDVFMRQFAKKVLRFESMFEMMKKQFKTFVFNEVIKSVKKSLELKEGKKVKLLPSFDSNSIKDKELCKIDLQVQTEEFMINLALLGNEREASQVVNLMRETSYSNSRDEHKHLKFIVKSLAERLKLNFEKFGIISSITETKIQNELLHSFKTDWKMILPFELSDVGIFIVGMSMKKTFKEKSNEISEVGLAQAK